MVSLRYLLGGFISLFMALISFGIAAIFGIGMLLAETFGRTLSPNAGLYATQDSIFAVAGIVGIIVFLSLAVYCFAKAQGG
jgi:hypothetical protein